MTQLRKIVPEEIVFQVCEKFVGLYGVPEEQRKGQEEEPMGATEISDWLAKAGYDCSRERVYRLIQQGIRLGFLQLLPPRHKGLERQLQSALGLREGQVRVVDIAVDNLSDEAGAAMSRDRLAIVLERLAVVAADVLSGLIQQVAASQGDSQNGGNDARATATAAAPPPSSAELLNAVHVGFGAGNTTNLVARSLRNLMRSAKTFPPLVIHALSSGFHVERPSSAPVAFFSYFSEFRHEVKLVGLFSTPMIPCEDYQKLAEFPAVQESFRRKDEIQIIVSSLASRQDPDGLLNKLMRSCPAHANIGWRHSEWVGDLQGNPYTATEPVEMTEGYRVVDLFNLSELRARLEQPHKHLILVCGPCGSCGRSKTDALFPLLTQRPLRVFDHLVTDVRTARETLVLLRKSRPAGGHTAP